MATTMVLTDRQQRIIFRCQNRRCNHTFSYLYQVREHYSQKTGQLGYYTYRRVVDGREISDQEDTNADCPVCQSSMSRRLVEGVYNPAKKCTKTCHNATGEKCECECGGLNHGSAYHC